MGERADDVSDISAVAAEVGSLRERTESVVEELEQRLRTHARGVRDVVDRVRDVFERIRRVKALVREHPAIAIGVGSVVTIALGLGSYLVVARIVEKRKPMNRLRARMGAYRTILAEPHRALRPRERLGKRLLKAMLVAGAVTMTRGFVRIFMKRVVQPRLSPPRTPRARLSAVLLRRDELPPPSVIRSIR
jgi:ElaB/YqjD/DUF883 family membrane-anchored ribosome-binding protein